ncbi:MAG: transporter substrate-binding domain-containing protein [Deltaproteobacteria bacterium]|jgi:two-component sensor histidine kinase/ABC-type amino acid transport substrate-binding protein|nr:transporter substrate-binding domain-containing protein [Deltaproteobacteria bacterium]
MFIGLIIQDQRKNFKTIIIIAFISLLTFFSPAISSAQDFDTPQKVSLQLQWKHQFEFAGFYAAKEKGYYQNLGLVVEIREYDRSTDIIQSVLSGKTTFGTLSSTIIKERMQNKPVMLLANYFKRSPLVFVTNLDIYSPEELKGKTVMGEKHEIENASFAQMFRLFHMTPNDFDIVPHTFSTEEFINGEVDAMTVFLTNEVYELRQKNLPFNIIDPNNYGVPFYDVNLFTAEDYADKNPKITRAFTEASNKGWKYALEHPEEIIELILKKYNSQNKTKEQLQFEAKETYRIVLPTVYPIGSIDPNRIMRIEESFLSEIDAGVIVKPESFIFDMDEPERILLTQGEKDFIKKHPVIRVANEVDWPPFDFAENGEPKGYSIDLIHMIAKKTGLHLEFVNGYDWDTLLKMGKRRKLDLFPAIWKTEERSQYFSFTAPYIDTPYILVVHETENRIVDIDSLHGLKVMGIKGFASTEQIKKYYPGMQIIEVGSAIEGLREVSYGKATAYLGSMAETNFAIRNNLIPNLKIAGETTLGGHIEPPKLYIGVRKDWPELQGIVQKALHAITHQEKRDLQAKWIQLKSGRDKEVIQLTEEEQAFLKANPILRVAFDVDWPPMEFSDGEGGMDGISADYLKRISESLGIRFEVASPRTWKEMMDAVKSGELHLFTAITPTEQRRKWMEFTDSYITFPIVIVTNKEVPYIGNMEDLAEKPISIVNGYAAHDLLSANYPDFQLIPSQGVKESLMMVTSGKAFAYVGSLATVSHIIGREGMTGLKVSGKTPYSYDISLAVRKGETVLLNLLRKSLAAIPDHERNAIYTKWIGMAVKTKVDYSLIWKIIGAALGILFLFFYWNRRLSNEVTERKQAEEKLKFKNTKIKQTEKKIRASLKEKETLLHEIHHRVKNNLAVISSLLGLQASSMNDKRLAEALMDSRNRVQSMSMIHETLYQSENLSAIDMNPYLSKLVKNIAQNYAIGSKVNLIIKAENIMIEVKQASPLALIVNELITNSFKYAFPDNQKGEVRICLQTKEDQIELVYSDNGAGIPKDFDWQNVKSMGLRLVKLLGEGQLGGSVQLKRDLGTCFIIKFTQKHPPGLDHENS